MYIKKADFDYFEGLYKGLDEAKRKRFLELLLKESSQRVGEDISKVEILDDSTFNEMGREPSGRITRTMIKKVYRAVKEV